MVPHESDFSDGLRLARRLIKAALGRDVAHRSRRRVPNRRMGNKEAAWVIYPAVLNRDAVIYSFGVGEDASFDLCLIEEFGATVHAFDPTPKSIQWVESRTLPRTFKFHRIGIAHFDGQAEFNAPSLPRHSSYTLVEGEGDSTAVARGEVLRLSTIMGKLGHGHVDLLKLDVEGAEYDVIDDMVNSGVDVRQLLIEFHHRFARIGIEKTNDAVARLQAHGFELFSVSPRGEEYSFIREDLI